MRKSTPLAERLLAKSAPQPNGCIHFVGPILDGYGRITYNGQSRFAHRMAYEVKNGAIPNGLLVLHRCDNRRCINTDHLFLGTHADNMADMTAKNRQSRLAKARGESHHNAKLKNEDITKIRLDTRRQVDIAADYGVTNVVVSRIKRGVAWRHV